MKIAGWVGLGALLLVCGASQAEKNSYTSGHFLLSLDGEPAVIKRFDPPKASAKTDAPFYIELDGNGSQPVWSWVQATLARGVVRKNLVIQQSEEKTVSFSRALITEVTIPKLDATATEPAVVRIKVVPKKTAPAPKLSSKGTASFKQKSFTPANFRVKIGGLPTGGVKKISSFRWTQTPAEDGKSSSMKVEPIRVSLDAADAPAWSAWLASKAKKTVSIELTDSDGAVWRSIDLIGVSVVSLETGVAVLRVTKLALR